MTPIHPDQDYDAEVKLTLKRDEAIVLYWYLGRLVLGEVDFEIIKPSIQHPSEEHALHALFQECASNLFDTGDPKYADQIHANAQKHLMARFE